MDQFFSLNYPFSLKVKVPLLHKQTLLLTKWQNIIVLKDCDELLKRSCFPLRKYMSNNVGVLQELPPESLVASPKSFMDSDVGIAVLGLSWHPLEIFFCCHETRRNFKVD